MENANNPDYGALLQCLYELREHIIQALESLGEDVSELRLRESINPAS